ncbi:uncharacterized protein B0H18DRAFT_957197 [Fomitopsis serialis]|uniref:uncharacterized protein n=1 Tax=Fomitopsis serialis TaxID=139415 RepID=UPI0020088C3D|nr:uncharacterized protein B0H18DRAFT_957197 [Neoantrodia serialis]KAH9920143.1 hypothetical protein B0H18DRAFT_957197 [Neoantrodia serialis]
MSSDDGCTSYDNLMQVGETTVKATNPLLLLVRLATGSFRASSALAKGDKAQLVTLRVLEKTHNIMSRDTLNTLHGQYEVLAIHRKDISRDVMERLKQWDDIMDYKKRSVALRELTVTSSHQARSDLLWKKGAKSGRPKSHKPAAPNPGSSNVHTGTSNDRDISGNSSTNSPAAGGVGEPHDQSTPVPGMAVGISHTLVSDHHVVSRRRHA